MSEPVLLVEKTPDGIATLTMNRPKAMNALSGELRGALSQAFSELEADSQTRVIILTGAGRAFCAGLDLKELGASDNALANRAFEDGNVVRAISNFRGPVIGAINGASVTGGFELALACDVLVGSTTARFADTHARVGILPGWGLSQKLSRAIGIYRAKELSLTGNYLSAEQAAAWGILGRVVAPDELLATCQSLARDMLSCVPEALTGYKRLIDEGFAKDFDAGMRIESEISRGANKTVDAEAIEERRKGILKRGREQTS
ncbi:MAG: enoyl-CoA hydratase [bacterium]|nr:enoyl-CoA hydratase [bacterium]